MLMILGFVVIIYEGFASESEVSFMPMTWAPLKYLHEGLAYKSEVSFMR